MKCNNRKQTNNVHLLIRQDIKRLIDFDQRKPFIHTVHTQLFLQQRSDKRNNIVKSVNMCTCTVTVFFKTPPLSIPTVLLLNTPSGILTHPQVLPTHTSPTYPIRPIRTQSTRPVSCQCKQITHKQPLSPLKMISVYELAATVLILALYTAYLGNLPTFDYHTAREHKLSKVRILKECIYRLDKEIIQPCEEVERSLRDLIQEYKHESGARKPTVTIPIFKRVRRENLRLFRYAPKAKAFVRVQSPKEKPHPQQRLPKDTNEFDVTNLRQVNKFGVNSDKDPYWHPQPRHPLSSLSCNPSTRRYPPKLHA
ncbi:hypothetical protein B0I72DRAFT_162314 [Yarrowia lipolytica]|uniref:YALI0A08558p n=1 Tax=Yarrowia lipolytica (strain CLIB 122 / E 150) TaxID=284591 RepID=Q6CHI2_YARLI|nr:YALI0A08558p [Yarrowia lipolytica CLIB122]RDW30609.1 hypothetical protein B0I72DRAFT_162314 [Yarrowia lipolytica]RDW36389.1 hypothetical protein B0I73DRAFT_177653 [Yarrowia lipolytica]RDW43610.1 hypothetical protein B0I74DRAFT_161871 [Yarrowia lipolytica]RDW50679.1 hypothetical protein B0I75DRAFT_167056 [Yarrowia lipolytica]CAG83806.1 YALI0A08558p [Yarrowia lipolytica CLIB122]|eukprot:XP_499879.1 YALI0A08558p [Yarrowia lipolytica CLIB122]